jgi:hypothetical protein
MRALVCSAALVAAVCAGPGAAAAQQASAAGWLGVGMFGEDPTTTVDMGLDVAGDDYAFGIGARLRYLSSDGVRSEDWDELSEVARLLRYFILQRGETVQLSLAVGELGGVSLGNGTIVDRYSSGLDVNHGHLGAQLRAAWRRLSFEALIDDLVAPRIVAARGRLDLPAGLEAGASAAIDMTAPSMAGARAVPLFGADLSARGASGDGLFAGRLYGDLVVAARTGAGMHLGADGSVGLGSGRLGARVEARLGTDGYVPGWIDPLYERTRADRLDRVRAGGTGGAGGLVGLSFELPEVGAAEVGYATRPGLPRLATARIWAPHNQWLQTALWAAAEIGGDDPARGMALETRAKLPGSTFLLAEVARLYRSDGAMVERIWIATAAFGAVVGE